MGKKRLKPDVKRHKPKSKAQQLKAEINSEEMLKERKREAKLKSKEFLSDAGFDLAFQEKWCDLLSQDKLSPAEKMQESAINEIINRRSLAKLQEIEKETRTRQ